jgi:hypothetical protein
MGGRFLGSILLWESTIEKVDCSNIEETMLQIEFLEKSSKKFKFRLI